MFQPILAIPEKTSWDPCVACRPLSVSFSISHLTVKLARLVALRRISIWTALLLERGFPYWEKTLNALYSVHMETCVLELHHVFYHAWSMMQSRMHCWPFVLDIHRCINMDALQNLTEVSGLNFWCICSGDRCFGAFWCAEISFVAAKKMTVIIICSLQNSEVTERNECSSCHTLCLYLCICPCIFVYLPLRICVFAPCVFVYLFLCSLKSWVCSSASGEVRKRTMKVKPARVLPPPSQPEE